MPENQQSLIIYFSLSGTTKTAAEKIQAATGADLVRIEATKAYPAGYDNYIKVAQQELDDQIHPAISTQLPDLDQYDRIFVGFPTWSQQPPMIIHTLFEQANFAGKTIIPFTTSMSTAMADSVPYLQKMAQAAHAKLGSGWRYENNQQSLDHFLQQNNF
ncbi:flavodoxin [Lapidilactobacillus mulanensis]|uniref:Flavodoxin n=1 Tax=Lapidilactobacillus mulanensis TaxID=2485999 RepID=A0ABW4DN54_9LACO|nr:flavodoxin [Lapidilactobacillus mulanensis]